MIRSVLKLGASLADAFATVIDQAAQAADTPANTERRKYQRDLLRTLDTSACRLLHVAAVLERIEVALVSRLDRLATNSSDIRGAVLDIHRQLLDEEARETAVQETREAVLERVEDLKAGLSEVADAVHAFEVEASKQWPTAEEAAERAEETAEPPEPPEPEEQPAQTEEKGDRSE